MPRLVVVAGVQYDADRLPPGVDASGAVPLPDWFRAHAVGRRVESSPPETPNPAPQPRRKKGASRG